MFVITGLPRTRTAWFAAYFSQGKTICYHEATAHGNNMKNPNYHHVGTADSGYVLMPEWVETLGEHKIVTIHRPVDDVAESLSDINQDNTMWLLNRMVPILETLPGLHVDYNDVNNRLREIHHYLELPDYDPERAKLFQTMNIQSIYWR